MSYQSAFVQVLSGPWMAVTAFGSNMVSSFGPGKTFKTETELEVKDVYLSGHNLHTPFVSYQEKDIVSHPAPLTYARASILLLMEVQGRREADGKKRDRSSCLKRVLQHSC